MAQRVYFPATTAADVSPAFDAGWSSTVDALRRKLSLTKGASAPTLTTNVALASFTAGYSALTRQYVSDPLVAGIVMNGTVKGQIIARASAANDDIDQMLLAVKVVSSDGTIVRATLLPLGNYANTANLGVGVSNHNEKLADGDAVTPYTTQLNDRLVIEIGFGTSTALGDTPVGRAWFGETGLDLPEDETDTDTTKAPWMEFSFNFAPPSSTRFYMAQSVSYPAQIPVGFEANWDRNRAGGVLKRRALPDKPETNTTIYSDPFGSTTTEDVAWFQWVSDPLDVDQVINQPFNMVVAASEADDRTNASIAYSLRVVKPDGTNRGILKQNFAASTEVPTTRATRSFNAIPVSSVSAKAGDRLLLEIGFHAEAPTVDSNLELAIGAANLTDHTLADGDTTNLNPWWELAQVITFAQQGSAWAFGTPSKTLSATASGTASLKFNASGAPTRRLDANASGAGSLRFNASGAPTRRLSAVADGSATMSQQVIIGTGAPRLRLMGTVLAVAANPHSPVPKRPKGGRVIIDTREPEKPKKKRKRKKRAPVEEAQPLAEVTEPLPQFEPAQIDVAKLAAALQSIMPQQPVPEPPIPEPTMPVEDRLMQHFIATLGGVPQVELDEDEMPFLLRRFLRLRH